MLVNLNNPRSAGPVSEQDLDARMAEHFMPSEAAHAATEVQLEASDEPAPPLTPMEKSLITLIYAGSAVLVISFVFFIARH